MRNIVLGLLAGIVLATTGIGVAASSAAPQETQQPTIEGIAREGERLTASNGGWSNNPTSYSFQWQRCDAQGQNCANIAGGDADDREYTLTSSDVGRTVRVLVTARNADGAATANSKPTAVVADNVRPAVTAEPTISGEPRVGATLTATEGSWTGAPERYSYQWQQCDAGGANCQNVAGATGKTYGVRSEDNGKRLRVVVTATNRYGSGSKESNATAVVTTGGGVAGATSSVAVSNVSLPDRLVVSALQFTPRVVTTRSQPIVARFRVSDTRGRFVSGALVYAQGLPFGRVAGAPEVTTDANGWATITFTPTAKFPLVKGGSMTFFVRARKPGDDVLAGVSTRRLVQVRIDPTR